MAEGFPDISPYEYHPDSLNYLRLRKQVTENATYDKAPSVVEIRQMQKKHWTTLGGEVDFKGTREHVAIPSPHDKNGIPVWYYIPDNKVENPAVFIYFHGGGYVLGERAMVDSLCKIISSGAGCVVVNVEYRLAPEHKYPAAFDDCEIVCKWVMDNKVNIGATGQSNVGVGGDSAGATLAAAMAHDVPGLAFQVLAYVHVMARYDYSRVSYQEFKDGPVLERPVVDWFFDQFLSRPEDARDSRMCVYFRDKFDHLPPCQLITAQVDILRCDSYEYKKKLEDANVHVDLELFEGAVHAFYTFPGACPSLCKDAHSRTINFIRTFQQTKQMIP